MCILIPTSGDRELDELRRRLRRAEIEAEKARIRRRLREMEGEGGVPALPPPWPAWPPRRPTLPPLRVGDVLRRIAAVR